MVKEESVAAQILSELGNQIPVTFFNDDDWYEFVAETGQFVRSYSSKYSRRDLPSIASGHSVERGMSAKHMMLWRIV